MDEKKLGAAWARPEVNVKLTRRRRELMRELLTEDRVGATPTQAIDLALETAVRSVLRDGEDARLLEATERGFAESEVEIAQLQSSVAQLTARIDSLCALIVKVAESEE
ncbi:MAG: hypothetical protein V4639_04555 [Pseudomonadota bacterium]